MALGIKSMDRIVAKWTTQSASATNQYEQGVKSPSRDWGEACASAEATYAAGVQAAIARQAYSINAAKAGTATWQKGALTKGVARWAAGIAISTDKYKAGFAPYREVIANLTLPARLEKGNAANIERVRIVAQALHAKKIGGGI